MEYLTTEVLGQRSGLFMLGSQGPRGSSSSGQHLMAGSSESQLAGDIQPINPWTLHQHYEYYSPSDKSRSSSGSIGGDTTHMLGGSRLPGLHTYLARSGPTPLQDPYWHIPRPSTFCHHTTPLEKEKCKQCQQTNDDCSSVCSSVNPPPTFTALDKYQPARPRPRCSCGIIFVITTIFSLLVLFLITAFILYIEMVLKHQTENVQNRMVM